MNDSGEHLEHHQTAADNPAFDGLGAAKISNNSEARYQQLVEFSPEAILMLQDDVVVYINRAGAQLINVERPEMIIGHPIREFVHPEYWPVILKRVERLYAANVVRRVEERVMLKGGETRDFEIVLTTARHQNRPAVQLIIRDISRCKRAEEALQARNRELSELNGIVSMMTSTLSLEAVLQTIVETAPRFCPPSSNATIQLLDKETGYLYTRASTSPLTPRKQRIEFAPGTGIVGIAVHERSVINVANVLDDPRYVPGPVAPPYHALLVIPLIFQDQVLGALSVSNVQVAAHTDDVVRQLTALAQYAAIAVQNAKLYAQAQQEIARRRQVEDALREHQDLLQDQNTELLKLTQAVEQSANVILITNVDGVVEYVNSRFEEVTGYSAAEMMGQVPSILQSSGHDAESYRALWQTITSGNVWRGEFLNQRKDGRAYWEQASIAPIYDEAGTMTHFVVSVEDITTRKEATDNLRERLQFEALLSELSAAFVTLPSESVVDEIQKWLQRIAEFLRVEQQALERAIPESADFASPYYYVPLAAPADSGPNPDPRDRFPWYWGQLLRGEVVIIDQIVDLPAEAAAERTYMLDHGIKSHVAIPLVVGDIVLGAIGLSTLQTERVWSADILQRLRLVSEVFANALMRQRTDIELREAIVAADAASLAKSAFLANMSHELRTPLNGILGYTQILLRDETLSERHLDAMHTIQHSGEHLLTLINDILDMSKIEAGKMELTMAEFHLPRFLQDVVDLFQVRARQKGLDFVFVPPPRLPVGVLGDERRLRQVLINLLGNAIKYTDEGCVTFGVGYDDKALLFRVEDTGPGISSEELELIFVPFRQASGRNKMVEGTGLGLPISRRLVELMQSKLHVSSTPGEGSVFWFKVAWPVVDAWAAPADLPKTRIVGYAGPQLKALVVDDNAASRIVTTKMLRPLGFDVREAVDGVDAVDQARAFRPDVILMDVVMPGMDGLQATTQIRAIPELHNTAVVAISASAFMEDQQRSLAAGCNAFIAKPFRHATLMRTLREQLDLTWIYETIALKAPDAAPVTMTVPPYVDLVELYKLALMGKIVDLRAMLDSLLAKDGAYEAFVSEIGQLAQNVRLRDVRRRLKTFLDNTEETS